MVEALVTYIVEQGFKVKITPHVIFIYKLQGDSIVGFQWAADMDLEMASKDLLFSVADQHMQAIEVRCRELIKD